MTISTTNEIVVVIGAGSIGQAITRRIGVGKTILLADLNENAAKAAADALNGAGFQTSTAHVDVAAAESVSGLADAAAEMGTVVHVVHTAGLSPAQASPQAIINVDLVGVAHVLEKFGRVIAAGGSGIVIASQAGHMLPPLPAEQNQALASTPAAELTQLPFLQPDAVTNSGPAYALAKRANILRVQAASVEWGDRGARLNSLSPGIIMTPLAMDELNSPAGAAYQQMIQASAAGRVGTPDEIGAAAREHNQLASEAAMPELPDPSLAWEDLSAEDRRALTEMLVDKIVIAPHPHKIVDGRRHYTIRAIPYQDPQQEAERLKAVHEARVKIVPRV